MGVDGRVSTMFERRLVLSCHVSFDAEAGKCIAYIMESILMIPPIEHPRGLKYHFSSSSKLFWGTETEKLMLIHTRAYLIGRYLLKPSLPS